MISDEVRGLVDEVHDLEDKNAAHQKAWDLMQAQLDALKVQAAGAPSLSPEDRAALVDSVNEIKTVADALVRAVPANTDMAQPEPAQDEQGTDQPIDPTTEPAANQDPAPTAQAARNRGRTN